MCERLYVLYFMQEGAEREGCCEVVLWSLFFRSNFFPQLGNMIRR